MFSSLRPTNRCYNTTNHCTKRKRPVAARFVTTARFITKVTKRAAMPSRFVTNEVVTNRAGIAPFIHLGISTCDIVCVTCVYVCVCVCARAYVCVVVCVRARACVCVCGRECANVRSCLCIYAWMYLCMSVCMWV